MKNYQKIFQSGYKQGAKDRLDDVLKFLIKKGKEDEGDFWELAYNGIVADLKEYFKES